jgi:hypothetical protein
MRSTRQGVFDVVLGFRSELFIALLLAVFSAAGSVVSAQTGKPDEPVYTNYRGVKIGATQAESRKALGQPQEGTDAQDTYVFNEKEYASIYFDAERKVKAISIDYLGDETKPPTAIQVVGSAADTKPDGSTFKMVRYPKAGYWVSYNRTAGQSPLISVTMQKMQ